VKKQSAIGPRLEESLMKQPQVVTGASSVVQLNTAPPTVSLFVFTKK